MAGEDPRFVEFYDRFHRPVYAYCRRRAQTDAVEDAVAETFLIAWKKSDEVPSGDQALPWLYGVAHRVLTHQWRSASRRQRLADKLASSSVFTASLTEELVTIRHEANQIHAALAELSPTDQEVLRLTAWEGLSNAEISVALGIKIGAVRQRLYSAKKNLADQYNRLEKRRTISPAAQKGGVW